MEQIVENTPNDHQQTNSPNQFSTHPAPSSINPSDDDTDVEENQPSLPALITEHGLTPEDVQDVENQGVRGVMALDRWIRNELDGDILKATIPTKKLKAWQDLDRDQDKRCRMVETLRRKINSAGDQTEKFEDR